MKKIPVILDCDTGVDDALAILLLHQIDQFEILGITTVAGNVEVEKTTRNTLSVLELIGANVPVYRGAETPLIRNQVTAAYVHGIDGLGGLVLPCSTHEVQGVPAWDALYQAAIYCKGELELIAIGPLTNLALALLKYRDFSKLIRRIVIMGGSATVGNVTPAAEFNIYADPEAADIVFNSGIPLYMCGLDVTMKAYLTPDEVDEIGFLQSKPAQFFRDIIRKYEAFYLNLGLPGVFLHDPTAVLYAVDPSFFKTHHVWIRVETKGLLTKGKTVTDLYSDAQFDNNAYIVTDIDREIFKRMIKKLMLKYG